MKQNIKKNRKAKLGLALAFLVGTLPASAQRLGNILENEEAGLPSSPTANNRVNTTRNQPTSSFSNNNNNFTSSPGEGIISQVHRRMGFYSKKDQTQDNIEINNYLRERNKKFSQKEITIKSDLSEEIKAEVSAELNKEFNEIPSLPKKSDKKIHIDTLQEKEKSNVPPIANLKEIITNNSTELNIENKDTNRIQESVINDLLNDPDINVPTQEINLDNFEEALKKNKLPDLSQIKEFNESVSDEVNDLLEKLNKKIE